MLKREKGYKEVADYLVQSNGKADFIQFLRTALGELGTLDRPTWWLLPAEGGDFSLRITSCYDLHEKLVQVKLRRVQVSDGSIVFRPYTLCTGYMISCNMVNGTILSFIDDENSKDELLRVNLPMDCCEKVARGGFSDSCLTMLAPIHDWLLIAERIRVVFLGSNQLNEDEKYLRSRVIYEPKEKVHVRVAGSGFMPIGVGRDEAPTIGMCELLKLISGDKPDFKLDLSLSRGPEGFGLKVSFDNVELTLICVPEKGELDVLRLVHVSATGSIAGNQPFDWEIYSKLTGRWFQRYVDVLLKGEIPAEELSGYGLGENTVISLDYDAFRCFEAIAGYCFCGEK